MISGTDTAVRAQELSVIDTERVPEHEQLRRPQGTSTQDDLARSANLNNIRFTESTRQYDSNGTRLGSTVVEHDGRCNGLSADVQFVLVLNKIRLGKESAICVMTATAQVHSCLQVKDAKVGILRVVYVVV